MGAALLYDKPIILMVLKGRKIPDNLRKVAHSMVEVDEFDEQAAQQLRREIEKLGEQLERGEKP